MFKQKGVTPASVIKIVVALIITLLAATAMVGIFPGIMGALSETDYACPAFCGLQAEIEQYDVYDVVFPSVLSYIGADIGETSEAIANILADELIQPKALGCYCGVESREGKYIHFHTDGEFDEGSDNHEDVSIREFHLTDQDPSIHLQYDITDSDGNFLFKHSPIEYLPGEIDSDIYDAFLDTLEQEMTEGCEEAIDHTEAEDMGINYLEDFDDQEGCVILSTGEHCQIWIFNETTRLTNEGGKTIEDMGDVLHVFSKHGVDEKLSYPVDPVSNLAINDKVVVYGGHRHESQRMLLQNYRDGEYPFNIYPPIVCNSTIQDHRKASIEMDEACLEYCKDEGKVFWSSDCHEFAKEGYTQLEEEYYTGSLCPWPDEPHCMCVSGKEYQWETVVEDRGFLG